MVEDVWADLIKDYPISNTPTKLLEALNTSMEGVWFNYGYTNAYHAKVVGNTICVSTDKSNRGSGAAGGNYWINNQDRTKCVEDF